MRWEYKPKTIYDKVKKRFALFPTLVHINQDEFMWIWLESYYSYSEEQYSGPMVVRFLNYQDMDEWLTVYENS